MTYGVCTYSAGAVGAMPCRCHHNLSWLGRASPAQLPARPQSTCLRTSPCARSGSHCLQSPNCLIILHGSYYISATISKHGTNGRNASGYGQPVHPHDQGRKSSPHCVTWALLTQHIGARVPHRRLHHIATNALRSSLTYSRTDRPPCPDLCGRCANLASSDRKPAAACLTHGKPERAAERPRKQLYG